MAWIVTKWLLLLLFWINLGSTLEIDHNQLGTQGEWILLYSLFSLNRVISVYDTRIEDVLRPNLPVPRH